MKFQVYSDLEIFETILLESEKYGNWNNILKNHSDVFVNISQDDYEKDIAKTEDSIIFQYLKDSGGKEPIPNMQFFKDFEKDNSIVVNKPLSTYFLSKDDTTIQSLIDKYGLIFKNLTIDDNILCAKFQKNCNEGEIIANADSVGWKAIMPQRKFVNNSLIITDPHLFNNSKNVNGIDVNYGVENIVSFLDFILPRTLGIDFHLLIVFSSQNKGISEAKFQTMYNDLYNRISALRQYNFIFELIMTPSTIHSRNSFSNYNLINCDKGFKIFSIDDPSKVHTNNKFKYFEIFEINDSSSGDSHFKELTEEIPKIKSGIYEAITTIKSVNRNLEDKKCSGLDSSYNIKNRLLNYFP